MYLLHYSPDTASLVVRMVLAELAVPHRARLIDRAAGELTQARYLALHPLAKIPAMETPQGPMFETAAMLLYLCDAHPGPMAPQPAATDRGPFLTWLFFTSTNIHPTLLQLFYPERTAGPDCAPQVLAHARAQMQTLLATLEAMVARDRPDWLSPHKPTLLGYYIAMLLHWLGQTPPDHPGHFASQDYPVLHAILTHLESRPAAQTIAADEGLGPTPFTHPI
jgi:glutathione S-transferase